MKRCLITIAIFVLAGAVVNVAVAWGCCSFVRPSRFHGPSTAESEYWTSRTPDIFEKPAIPQIVASSESFGVRRHIGWTPFRNMLKEDPGWVFHAEVIEAGWPAICMNGQFWKGGSSGGSELLIIDGVALPRAEFHWSGGPSVLPLRPILPGFAVNTLLYAALLWLLIPGPFALRRFIRVKRGRCPKCGYPMGEAAVCSECGTTLPQRAVA